MPTRILVFLFGDLGDTLLTVPALRAVRRRYPEARIVMVGKDLPGAIVTALGLVDQVIDVNKHLFDRPSALLRPRAWRELRTLWRRLRAEDADTVLLFHHLVTAWGTLKFAVLTLASGAKRRVGLDNGRGWFLTERVKDRGFGTRHESEYWLAVAKRIGAEGDLQLEAPLTDADRLRMGQRLEDLGLTRQPIVAIHAGTGWYGPGRRWDPARFAQTVQLMSEQIPARYVLVGSSQDREQVSEVSRLLDGKAVDLAGQTTVGELAALLERCTVLIANDSGVGHLAAAVGIPVVSIFGPSNDRAWRPLTATVIAADLPCRPCFYRDFERGLPRGCKTRECLGLVSAREVADTTIQIFSNAGAPI